MIGPSEAHLARVVEPLHDLKALHQAITEAEDALIMHGVAVEYETGQ